MFIMPEIDYIEVEVPLADAIRLWRDGDWGIRLGRSLSAADGKPVPRIDINPQSDAGTYNEKYIEEHELEEAVRTLVCESKNIRYRIQMRFTAIAPNENKPDVPYTRLIAHVEIEQLKGNKIVNYLKAKACSNRFRKRTQEVLKQFKKYAEAEYYNERLRKKKRVLDNFLRTSFGDSPCISSTEIDKSTTHSAPAFSNTEE